MRTVPAVLFGAGGATAAIGYGESIYEFVKESARAFVHNTSAPSWDSIHRGRADRDTASALSSEIEALKKLVREAQGQKSVVVVNGGGGASRGLLTYTAAAACLGYLYLRYVKGWGMADLFYVSQASLKASTSAIKQGIDGLKDFTSKTKEYLQGRLEQLETKQGEHMAKTEKIDERITVMHEDVDGMRGEIEDVGTNVRDVQGTLGEIQGCQQYNSQGIFLLLRVVGELVCSNDFRIGSRQDLDQFSRTRPPLPKGISAPGLESLRDLGPPSQRAPGRGGQASSVPSLVPSPDVADITAVGSENSSELSRTGRKVPRVLTRGAGNSGGTLVSSAIGNSGFGVKVNE